MRVTIHGYGDETSSVVVVGLNDERWESKDDEYQATDKMNCRTDIQTFTTRVSDWVNSFFTAHQHIKAIQWQQSES